MAVEQILKSWLRSRYTDNNTLKSTFNAGSTLTVPDTSNSTAEDTDMNTLLTSIRAMQSNVYLRHSPLWSTVDLTAVSEGGIIAETKKTDIDNLTADLLQMCANYSYTLNPAVCVQDTQASAFSKDSRSSGNSNNSRASSFGSNNSQVAGWGQNGSNGSRSYGRRTLASSFFNNGNVTGFSNNSQSSGNTNNTANASSFAQNTRFSQEFNYSFIVKSDRTTTSNTRTTAE